MGSLSVLQPRNSMTLTLGTFDARDAIDPGRICISPAAFSQMARHSRQRYAAERSSPGDTSRQAMSSDVTSCAGVHGLELHEHMHACFNSLFFTSLQSTDHRSQTHVRRRVADLRLNYRVAPNYAMIVTCLSCSVSWPTFHPE